MRTTILAAVLLFVGCGMGGLAFDRNYGESCGGPFDCVSGLCADEHDGNGQFCSLTCETDADCQVDGIAGCCVLDSDNTPGKRACAIRNC